MVMNEKRHASILVLALLLLIPSITPVAGSEQGPDLSEVTPIDDPRTPPWGYYKGILPTPKQGGDITLTYENASTFTQMVPVWGRPSPFYNLSEDLNGAWGDLFVDQLIRENGMFPLVHMNFHGTGMSLVSPPELPSATLSDPDWRALYIQSAKDIVNASGPRYLSIGNEVNRWFEEYGMDRLDPNGFQNYISLYNETYDAIKALSPDTRVFCTFSREIVKDNREANLSILEHFDPDRMDVLVFTSYPFAVSGINRAADMDDDYYFRAFSHFSNKPFGLSEVAWKADPAFGGERGQSDFVSDLFSRFTASMDVEFLSWNWLHDLGTNDLTGLKDMQGNERSAYRTWINNTEPSYDRHNRTIELMEDFGTYTYDLNRTFFDPDPLDTLEFSVFNGTDYSNYTETKVKAEIIGSDLILTSIQDVFGVCQLNIRAEDWSGLTNWTIIQITIENINDAPKKIENFPDPHRFSEGQSSYMDISYYIMDPDHPFMLLNGEIIESPDLVASIDLLTSPYLTLYSQEVDWFGETHVKMNISDPEGAFLIVNLSVSVTPVNDPPISNAPSSMEIEEDHNITVDLSEWFVDPDGDALTFELFVSDPSNIYLDLNRTFLLISSAENWHGTAQLTVNASDGSSYVRWTTTIRVISVNDDPVLKNISRIDILEDQDRYLPLSLFEPTDPDEDTLYISILNFSENLWSVSILPNETIHIKPVRDRNGNAHFTMRLEDGRGGTAEMKVEVRIEPVNDAPIFIVPPNWTAEVEPGGYREIDLSGAPYLVEDVDHDLGSLEVSSDYELIEFDGLLMNITLPEDISSTEFTIGIHIRDPMGAASEERELTVKVVDLEDEPIQVDNITITSENGVIEIRVEGDPYQDIWAVISGEGGIIASYRIEEITPGSGSYELNIDDLDRENGEILEVHLSTEEGGNNDSNLPASPFTYNKRVEDEGDDPEGSVFTIVLIAVLVVVAVLLLLGIWSRRKGKRISEFDYGSLLEE
ncbi:MAG: tandem-95 repeat protein [Thermoplasmatota archaeon]